MKSSIRNWSWLIPTLFWLGMSPQPGTAQPAASHFEIPASDDGLPGQGPIRRYDWFRKLWVERRSYYLPSFFYVQI